MMDMLSRPSGVFAARVHDVSPPTTPPASRLGLVLFAVYLFFYLGFVLISALAGELLETMLPGGLNLAVVYGFGLIILALLLAAIYGWLKKSPTA